MAHDGLPPAPPTAPAPLARDRARPLSEPCATRSTRYVPDAPSLASPYRFARRLVQVAVPGLFLSLAACGGNMEEPKVQINPNPSARYRVHFTVDKTPKQFDAIDALVNYDIANEDCLPRDKFSGARRAPSGRIYATLEKAADGSTVANIATDGLLDEDYYGLGVCHWKFVAVSIRLHVDKLIYSTALFEADLKKENVTDRRFPLSGFSASDLEAIIPALSNRDDSADALSTFGIAIRVEGPTK